MKESQKYLEPRRWGPILELGSHLKIDVLVWIQRDVQVWGGAAVHDGGWVCTGSDSRIR